MQFLMLDGYTPSNDVNDIHRGLPRTLRKALRVPKSKAKSITHNGVDSYISQGYKVDTYHTQNLEYLDRPFDFDEFGDVDDEYKDLTITEPMDEAELFAFCTGYDIL